MPSHIDQFSRRGFIKAMGAAGIGAVAANAVKLQEAGAATGNSLGVGCTHICEPALDGKIPVGDVLRCLMYANS